MKSHIKLAHHYWKCLLKPGDRAIDATCGNGHDSEKIASMILSEGNGRLYLFDIQPEAIARTKQKLELFLDEEQRCRVAYYQQCHSDFPKEIANESIKLITYNLGYLPSGNKSITTMHQTTLKSLWKACDLIVPYGMISIMCYPGHAEGEIEEKVVKEWASSLPRKKWSCCFHQWINGDKSPSLFILQRIS